MSELFMAILVVSLLLSVTIGGFFLPVRTHAYLRIALAVVLLPVVWLASEAVKTTMNIALSIVLVSVLVKAVTDLRQLSNGAHV